MPCVFIVDDDPDTTQVLSIFLQGSGLTVETFNDFKTAEHKIVRDHPCIVFTDFHMFGDILSAPQFIERIKAHFPALKMVIVSGNPLKRVDADRLGVEFMLKPADLDRLRDLCCQHCGGC